jgi:glycosyltransferase involved in cell wall biosynthesis
MSERRLKVLFLTNWYPSKEHPVRAVWAREYAKALRCYDEVVVLHCAGADANLRTHWIMDPEMDAAIHEGVPTYRLRYRPAPIPHMSYLLYIWGVIRAFRQIVDHGFRPDVVHVHVYDAGVPALIMGKLHHIPVVVSEHFSSFPRRLLGNLDLWKAWCAFRFANAVLPVSHALQKAIESHGLRGRFHVVPNVADTALFSPPVCLRENTGPKRILFVGQLVKVKGLQYLLQALARLREKRADWLLDIVGDGDARAQYEHMAASLGLSDKVTFHGLKTKRDVAGFMRRADLFVLPSLVETFSVPAVEALATGIPVLATNCGGPEEFIAQQVGLLVPPGDANALCAGIDYMFDNLHRYSERAISEYAKECFSPEVVGARVHGIYQSISPTPCTQAPG